MSKRKGREKRVKVRLVGLGVLPRFIPNQSKARIKLANERMIDHLYFLKQKGYANPLLPDEFPNNLSRIEAWQIIQIAEKQLLKSKKIKKCEMYIGG